jgi:hypothetical protein
MKAVGSGKIKDHLGSDSGNHYAKRVRAGTHRGHPQSPGNRGGCLDGVSGACESPSTWVIQLHRLIKGNVDYNAQFIAAEAETGRARSVHLSPDTSIDNLLMLLVTVRRRSQRGEESSAHAWLAAAWDMIICLCRKRNGVSVMTDLLDARRRVETEHPALAAALHRSLFGRPGEGVIFMVEYLQALLDGKRVALAH